jgi:hypothetical protein
LVLKPNVDVDQVKKILIHDLKNEIKDNVTYKTEIVASIPPEPTGKLRMVVSRVTR